MTNERPLPAAIGWCIAASFWCGHAVATDNGVAFLIWITLLVVGVGVATWLIVKDD